MKVLHDHNFAEAEKFMTEAAKVAQSSMCGRSRGGCVIVDKDGNVIGSGYNSPPLDDINNGNCENDICCVHAEQRAIMSALKNHSEKLKGAKLYFVRIDKDGNVKKSGKPNCTVCSRLSLDTEVSQFLLWHEEGITEYNTDEYNQISIENRLKQDKKK